MMTAWWRQRLRGYVMLREGLERLAADLPNDLSIKFSPNHADFYFDIPKSLTVGRALSIWASPGSVEYQFGAIWTENLDSDPATARELLAACDAVLAGRVREVRDLKTGLLYHVYQLRTRGLHKFARDSQYAFRHYLREKVRQVRITRIPPLVSS